MPETPAIVESAPVQDEPQHQWPVTVEKVGSKFYANFKYDPAVKDFVKAAGFKFDGSTKKWWTNSSEIAAKVGTKAQAEGWLEKFKVEQAEKKEKDAAAIEASKAADADINVPVPQGLSYLPYQKAGVAYGLSHKNVLIGDEMGLGKTIQAIGISNADPNAKKILIICPASLKLNWRNEWQKWDTKGLKVGVAEGKTWPADADVVIVNYDIAAKHKDIIEATHWDLEIADECHYLKNPKAIRTKAILGDKGKGGFQATRRVMLTGTPIVNRPVELWPIVQAMDPDGLGKNFFGFAKRYCGATQGYGGHWDFSGASHLDELQGKLRASFMVRRLKKDVLKELPPKNRSVVVLQPSNDQMKVIAKEQAMAEKNRAQMEELKAQVELAKASDNEAAYKEAVNKLNQGCQVAFTEMAEARKEVAIAKIPDVIERAKDLLEQTDKIVIMAHHHEVVDQLKAEFGEDAVVVDGRVKVEERQANVEAFQKGKPRIFIGTIKAAGVGLTLTASHTVLFAELDWVPGNVTQAEDRCHRIGQKDNVDIYHVVLDGSMDAKMAQTLVSKQVIIDKALDKGTATTGEAQEAPAMP
ncbi:MAG TPA: DEAD/DEAH box helicase, partial [Holophaga sp.]|nr:DEAD/DEAH box helicase [Holophaga sp.]